MRGPERKRFVEGGGNRNKALQTECREAFRTMLERSGLRDRMPRIIACGRRSIAYAQFKTAMEGLQDGRFRNPCESRGIGPGREAPTQCGASSPGTTTSKWRPSS